MNRTGVVVVTYNSGDVIRKCLDSCGDLPVVVVDNASSDDTCVEVRQKSSVTLISNSANLGFAAAVNQGVRALDTELVLLLNPDTELQTPIDLLEAACTGENAGLAGGKLTDDRGVAQQGFTLRRFPTPATLVFETLGINRVLPFNPVNRRYRCLDVDLSRSGNAEQPPGAFLMFRREVWHQLAGFDTQFYPLWFEDVDFCRRAHDQGFQIQYVPQVIARHQGGHSIAKLDWGCRELCWYVSLLRYASKHFRPYAFRGVSAAVVLGSPCRAVLRMIQLRSARPIKVYAKIAKFAVLNAIVGRAGQPECLTNHKAVGRGQLTKG